MWVSRRRAYGSRRASFQPLHRRVSLVALAFALSALAANSRSPAPAADLPADDPMVEVLRRTQTREGRLLPSQAFPQSQASLQAWLRSRWPLSADSPAILQAFDSRRSQLLRWSDSARGNALTFSPETRLGWTLDFRDDAGGARLAGFGGTLAGRLGPYLSFRSHALAYSEFTDKAQFSHQFDPMQGETYSVEKGPGDSLLFNRSFNRYENYALLELPGVLFKAGRDRVRMGPGYFQNLTAGKDTPPYWLIEARVDFAPWLTLDDYLLKMTASSHSLRKYANLHRFEFKLPKGLSLAFQDIVIYQDRDPEPEYALPLVPLTFVESNNGGLDNAAMGFDFLYAGLRSLSIWGELFLDDLLGPGAFFDDFWENRWAGLLGFQIVSPWSWADADLVVEYAHVEPWTYTGRRPETSFRHFNVPSASRLGPDSRTWDFQLSWRPFSWLEFLERFGLYEQGLGRPADLGAIHDDAIDGTSKAFLGGPTRTEIIWSQAAVLRWRQYLFARLEWAQDLGDVRASTAAAKLIAAW